MNEQQFTSKVDKLFLSIEECIEKADIDFENHEGMLTIQFNSGEQLIFSRQTVSREVWLASKKGAFHFYYAPEGWISAQKQTLTSVLASIIEEKTGRSLDLSIIEQ